MSQPPAAGEHRAGLGVMLVAVGFPSLLTWGYFVALADAPAAARLAVYTLGKMFQFALPLAWWLCEAGRRQLVRGTSERPKDGVQAAWGFAVGAAMFAGMLGVYYGVLRPWGWLAGAEVAVHRKLTGFGVTGSWSFLALASFYAVVHAGLEEYYWRWFVFGQLRDRMALPWALAICSVAFAAHHVILLKVYVGMGLLGIAGALAVAAAGGVWAWMYHRSGSLVGPWASHILADAAIFVVAWDLAGPVLAK